MGKKPPREEARSKAEAAICRRLRDARESYPGEPSQEVVAEALGISKEQYRKYEKRNAPPSWLLPRICEYFDMEPWFLLTGQHSRKRPDRAEAVQPSRPFPARP